MARGNHREKLEINQDLDLQRREWQWQRVGWAAMIVLLAAALLGLLGPGLLSYRNASALDGSLRMEYQGFLHYHHPQTLRIHIAAGMAEGARLRLWLDREYLESIEIQKVTPEPESVEAGRDRRTYVFRVADSAKPTTITFFFEADTWGSLAGQIALDNREALFFHQFVYP